MDSRQGQTGMPPVWEGGHRSSPDFPPYLMSPLNSILDRKQRNSMSIRSDHSFCPMKAQQGLPALCLFPPPDIELLTPCSLPSSKSVFCILRRWLVAGGPKIALEWGPGTKEDQGMISKLELSVPALNLQEGQNDWSFNLSSVVNNVINHDHIMKLPKISKGLGSGWSQPNMWRFLEGGI